MILALDPGGTTGHASYFPEEDPAFVVGQVQPDQLWEFLQLSLQFKMKLIICESFNYRPKAWADLTPVECIGVIKEFARHTEIPTIFQTPEQGKHFFTDDRLKERKLYRKKMPHANDALRHLLYFLEFDKRASEYTVGG